MFPAYGIYFVKYGLANASAITGLQLINEDNKSAQNI